MSQKIFEIHPKRPISGVLPNNKRITEVTRIPLDRAEFIRCMHFGTVYAVTGNEKIVVTDMDYAKALALFDKDISAFANNKTIRLTDSVKPRDRVNIKPIAEKIQEVEKAPEPMTVEVVEDPNTADSEQEEEKEIKAESVTTTDNQQTKNTVSVASKKRNKHR